MSDAEAIAISCIIGLVLFDELCIIGLCFGRWLGGHIIKFFG